MQQKEVLIIVGVLVVGLFLFKQGTLSGRSVFKNYVTYPNQIGESVITDAYSGLVAQPTGAGTGGGRVNVCGVTYYEVKCEGTASFGCYPGGARPIVREDCRYDPSLCGRSIEGAREDSESRCSDCVVTQAEQAGRNCQAFCRANHPQCEAIWFPLGSIDCSRSSCNGYVCEGGESGPGSCSSSAQGLIQCICLGAPIF